MKKLLIFLIKGYQKVPGPWHACCRHIPSCSNYAILAIERFGAFKGSKLALKRILRCNPLGTKGIDLVPTKGEKL